MKLDASGTRTRSGESSSCTTPGATLRTATSSLPGPRISHYPAAVDLPEFAPGSEVLLRPEPDNRSTRTRSASGTPAAASRLDICLPSSFVITGLVGGASRADGRRDGAWDGPGAPMGRGGTRAGRPPRGHERQRSAAAVRRSLGATCEDCAPSLRGAEGPAVRRPDRADATDGCQPQDERVVHRAVAASPSSPSRRRQEPAPHGEPAV